MYKFLIIFLFSASIFADINLPKGKINPDITQDNINENICIPNWTSTVRPNTTYTNKLKLKQLTEFNFVDKDPKNYEEDHIISISLAGSVDSPDNLIPQSYIGKCNARIKDKIEVKLHRLICSRKITLQQAQTEISQDWVASYNKRIGKLDCK
jgi:hypothetical protein